MERLHKFFRLPPGERVVLVQAWLLFLLVELALGVLSFQRLLTLLHNRGLMQPEEPAETVPSPARLAWLVEVASRFTPVTATCLKQALVLSWLLKRRGIATTLHIGVARREGTLAAHAWLESNGQVLFGQAERDGFTPLVPAR